MLLTLGVAILACNNECFKIANAKKTTGKHDFSLCKDLAGCPLEGYNFKEATMQGVILTGANLNRTNFEKADLTGAKMDGVTMADAKLKGAVMTGVDLTGASAPNCDWQSASINGEQSNRASFVGGYFAGPKCNFNNANLKSADMTDADVSFCTFDYTTMEGTTLDGADFSKADLSKALITDIEGEGVTFDGTIFTGVTITDANFTDCSFRSAKMYGIKFEDVKFYNGADFTGADLRKLILADSLFANAILAKADLTEVSGEDLDFSGADISNAIFHKAKLADTKFIGVKAVGADFMGAFLEAADFEKAQLNKANFDKANINRVNFKKARLRNARLTDANGGANIFCGANLMGAKMDRASLKESFFGTQCGLGDGSAGSTGKGAVLTNAVANDADFTKAVFTGARGTKSFKVNKQTISNSVDVVDAPWETSPSGALTYKMYSGADKATWEDAKAACEKTGGALAEASSTESQVKIATAMKNAPAAWVGGSDKKDEGKWTWIASGTEIKPLEWGSTYKDSKGKDCMLYNPKVGFQPVKCGLVRPYVCQE